VQSKLACAREALRVCRSAADIFARGCIVTGGDAVVLSMMFVPFMLTESGDRYGGGAGVEPPFFAITHGATAKFAVVVMLGAGGGAEEVV